MIGYPVSFGIMDRVGKQTRKDATKAEYRFETVRFVI